MLRVELDLFAIDVGRDDIVSLFESVNSPMVNLRDSGAGQTLATVISSITVEDRFQVFVHLSQINTDTVCVYCCEPPELSQRECQSELTKALEFLETMGFRMIDRQFSDLSIMAQLKLMERLAVFTVRPSSKSDFRGVSKVVRGNEIVSPSFQRSWFGGLSTDEHERLLHNASGSSESTDKGHELADDSAEGLRANSVVHVLNDVLEPGYRSGASAGAQPPPAWDDAEETGQDREQAMLKLGRLLSTFGLILSLCLGACSKTPRPNAPVPPAIQTLVDIGNEHLKQGRWRVALQVFQEVLRERGNTRDAFYGQGLAYIQLGRAESAEASFRDAIRVDPKWSIAKNILAKMLVDRGLCDEARQLLDEVRKDIFYPTPWFADFHSARALACQGDRGAAIRRLQTLSAGRPEFCVAYLQMAEYAVLDKQYELAVRGCETFTKACENNKYIKPYLTAESSCMCAFWAGRAYAALGDVESARSEFLTCNSTGDYGKRSREALDLLDD